MWLALAFAPTGNQPVPLVVVLHGDRVKGGDHAREEAALTPKKGSAILDWLAAQNALVNVLK